MVHPTRHPDFLKRHSPERVSGAKNRGDRRSIISLPSINLISLKTRFFQHGLFHLHGVPLQIGICLKEV
jgi:hypothetical protein